MKGLLVLLLSALAFARVAASADQPVQPLSGLTVEQLVATALRDSPRLAAMRAEWEAMSQMPAQERALPNPMLTYKGSDMAGNFPGAAEKQYDAEQTIPWPGKLGLKGRMAEKDADRAWFEYQAMRRETVMMVKEGYYDLCAVRKSIAIVQTEQNVLGQMEQVAETKYSTGEVSQQDVTKAQAEIPMLQGRILELMARETTLTARLNTLMNLPASAHLELTMEPPLRSVAGAVEPLITAAQTNRPEIKASEAMVQRGEAQKSLMRREYLPDITVGVEYTQSAGAEDMAMFMVGLDLPLWVTKNSAGVREAERRIDAGYAGVEAAQSEAQFDVQDAWFRLRTAQQTLDLYEKDLVPQADLRFKASEAGYRAGKVDFMDLLESERFLLNARLMQVMAEGEMGMRSARLEWATGAGTDDGR